MLEHYLERYQKLVKRLCIAYHCKDDKEIQMLVYALSNLRDEIQTHLTMLAPDKGRAAVVEDESGSAPCG